MTRYPGALWLPLSRNYTARKRHATRGVILHVAGGESKSLRGWFNDPRAKASSHLYIRRDGTVEQYVDMDQSAWTSGSASYTTLGIETQGGASGGWTSQQVDAIARLLAWAHRTYGIPLRMMQSSMANERGIGWHRLGVDGNFPSGLLGGRRQRGKGASWSKSAGKVCPGDTRIRQIPDIIARAQSLVAGGKGSATSPEEDILASKEEVVEALLSAQIGRSGKTLAQMIQETNTKTNGTVEGVLASKLGRSDVTVAQALQNTNSNVLSLRAQVTAYREALSQVAGGGSVDYARIDSIVREAVASGIDVTVTVPSKEN